MTKPPMPDAALLPCPFCGSEAMLSIPRYPLVADCDDAFVFCLQNAHQGPVVLVDMDDDDASLGWPSCRAEAIAAWNRRAGQAHERRADAGLLAALEEALGNLLKACERADCNGNLSEEIDGTLLTAARDALEFRFPIIWTAEQVEMLVRRQNDAMAHPYTCGGDRSDEQHLAQAAEDCEEPGLLIPTQRGWICPACDYRQFWSHETGELSRAAIAAAKGHDQ